MWKTQVSGAVLSATLLVTVGVGAARADEPAVDFPDTPDQAAMAAPDQPGGGAAESPIPPYVESAPLPYPSGGYCFVGPHPVDARVEGGNGFDQTQGAHIHNSPPIDLRLFTFKEGCYYFIGDPRDFGYGGQVYSYYGAHPVLDVYGGGWCFMMGGHYHLWQPWSPYFTVVGPWHYWYGPYDPFFWAYWPYYSFYYRSYYPRYYAGGRYYRGGYGVAPAIRRVPAPSGWRGTPTTGALNGGGTWRGTPAGAPGTSSALRAAPGWTGTPAGGAPSGGWRASPVPNPGIRPSTPFHSAPSGGGFHFRGGHR